MRVLEREGFRLVKEKGSIRYCTKPGLLERLGVGAFSRLPFTLADGRTLERDTSAVLLTIDGRKAAVPVGLAEPGEEAVLGATTPEILGLLADPVTQKLVPRNLLALVERK